MKKFTSIVLALALVLCMSVTAFAAGETTTVTYTGTASESYTLTVPATMEAGDTDNVNLSGTWASNRQATVSCPSSIVMTCDLDNSTQNLTITFPDLVVVGDNENAISEDADITVADMSNVLFGTWTGTIEYTVEFDDVA